MSLESTSARSEQLARQIHIYGRPISPTEVADHIDAVDAVAMSRVARRIISSVPSLATVGPAGESNAYARVLERFSP